MTMKTISKKTAGIKVTATIKAGGFSLNHSRRSVSLSVKSGIKAGDGIYQANHTRCASIG
jgi:hypothetical protein